MTFSAKTLKMFPFGQGKHACNIFIPCGKANGRIYNRLDVVNQYRRSLLTLTILICVVVLVEEVVHTSFAPIENTAAQLWVVVGKEYNLFAVYTDTANPE
jgi:hypothetical protein